jgi:HEAT repeat protein
MRRCLLLPLLLITCTASAAPAGNPYDHQVGDAVDRLDAESSAARARAAESLGFLRAYAAEDSLIGALDDRDATVRRNAALALAWCGGRKAVQPLLRVLDDKDWSVAQAAWVALTNVTGMEFPFDALAEPVKRQAQIKTWRQWWDTVPDDRPPQKVLDLLTGSQLGGLASGCPVKASSVYKGPPALLTDGRLKPTYFQMKNVPFPQSVVLDLKRPVRVGRVVVHQYGRGYCLTDYALATSLDGETYEQVCREKGTTPPKLEIAVEPRQARYLKLTAYANENSTYPMTVFEIEAWPADAGLDQPADTPERRQERALRALGALGGHGAAQAVYDFLEPMRVRPSQVPKTQHLVLRAGIRAVGRLGDERALPWLIGWLWETPWARYAAQALGDLGDPRAVPALLAAYPRYSRGTNLQEPDRVPRDDKMGFPHLDRMYETPHAIAMALCRLPLDEPSDRAALRQLAALLLANLPQDHDAAMVYEPEVGERMTRHLLQAAGLRQEACEQAFDFLGQPRRVEAPANAPSLPTQNPGQTATWLPALCREAADLPRLAALLDHKDRWVRLNAAKAIGFMGHQDGIAPLADALDSSKPEAEYGYSGKFLDEEYNDPAPRWREAVLQALGMLDAEEHVPLIVQALNDDRNVLEVRYAAAEALAAIATEPALKALRGCAVEHPFYTVRQVAREALFLRGKTLPEPDPTPPKPPAGKPVSRDPLDAIVFIQGENALPNHFQNDRWRQAYVTTDTGPTYRPGRNLAVLRPARPDGSVTPLTEFEDGYVADCEVSWDGRRVLFCRRGQENPWWHVFEINADGTGLRQLTHGPYHDVQPAYLPDGRIVFSSSRIGTRDEYHGYLCTALHVMNPDGSDIHPIAINVGRDNEPAALRDGRVAFSRLEVFYSRLKTELTLHACQPDGTADVVLYGPERRAFWRRLNTGPRGGDYASNVFATHRILRMSQPQSLRDGRILCASQGGLVAVGPNRTNETILTPDKNWAYTTPWPLPDGRILCAATRKAKKSQVDLGLYLVEPETGQRTLVYNDPKQADYEARPLAARPRPPVLVTRAKRNAFTGRFTCLTVHQTQEDGVPRIGRLVRLIEGLPVVGRHSTQTNPWEVWKNHGGTVARVLGTAPLAADGSFYVEAPADRLLHFQVLDSNRRVLGNQLTWIYTRPGESRSCIGCHEHPDTTPDLRLHPKSQAGRPIRFLPTGGDEFRYRAKAWLKGRLPAKVEERTRTVRSINLLAR